MDQTIIIEIGIYLRVRSSFGRRFLVFLDELENITKIFLDLRGYVLRQYTSRELLL